MRNVLAASLRERMELLAEQIGEGGGRDLQKCLATTCLAFTREVSDVTPAAATTSDMRRAGLSERTIGVLAAAGAVT